MRRHWWLEEFKLSISNLNERNYISLEQPKPFFIDRTPDIKEWDYIINTHTLPNLRIACNKYCISTVSCPFGCSTFIFGRGSISLDIMFQRFLPKCVFKKFMSNKESFKFVESVRNDFIHEENDVYDRWLLNDN